MRAPGEESRKERVDRRTGLGADLRPCADQGASLCSTFYSLLAPAPVGPRPTRGDCPNFEPARAVAPFAGPFLGPVEPFILAADRLARQTA